MVFISFKISNYMHHNRSTTAMPQLATVMHPYPVSYCSSYWDRSFSLISFSHISWNHLILAYFWSLTVIFYGTAINGRRSLLRENYETQMVIGSTKTVWSVKTKMYSVCQYLCLILSYTAILLRALQVF